MKPQTIVRYDKRSGVTIITRTCDGASVHIWNIGRCWCMADDHPVHGCIEIAGRPCDHDAIVRWLRAALRRSELPVCNVHCCNW